MPRKIKPKKGELPEVRVHWVDACAASTMDTFEREELADAKALDMWDYGVLLGKNNKGDAYLLASNFSSAGHFRRVMVLPLVYVKEIVVLGYVNVEGLQN